MNCWNKLSFIIALSWAATPLTATAATQPQSCRGIYTADRSLAAAVNSCAKTVKNSKRTKILVKRGKTTKGKKKTQKATISRAAALSTIVQLASGRSTDLAPGALASIQGKNLASDTCSATEGSLPLKLCGIEVVLRNTRTPALRAPLSFVTASRIDFQLPEQLTPGRVTLRVLREGRIIINDTPLNVTSSGFSPLEQPNAQGPLCSRLLREEEGNTAGDRSAESFLPITPTNPTQAGDLVRCLGTGLGAVSPRPFSGTLISGEHLRSDRELTVHVRYPDTKNDDRLLRGRVYQAGRKEMAVGVDEILFSLPYVDSELLFGNTLQVALCEHATDDHFAPANRCGKDFALPYKVTPFNNTLGAYPDYERSFPANRLNCSGDLLKCAELAQKEGYPTVLMEQGRVHYSSESPKKIVDSALIVKSADVREIKTEVYPGQTFPTRVVSLRQNEVIIDNSNQPECTGAPHPALQGLTPQPDELFVLMTGGTVTIGQTLVTSEALIPFPSAGVYLLEPLPCSPQTYTLRHPLGMYIWDSRSPSPGESPVEVIRSLPGNHDIKHPLRYLDIVLPFEPLRALGYNSGAYLLQDFRQALLNLDGTSAESTAQPEQLAWITYDDEPQDPHEDPEERPLACIGYYKPPVKVKDSTQIIEFALDTASFSRLPALNHQFSAKFLNDALEKALAAWHTVFAKAGVNVTLKSIPFNPTMLRKPGEESEEIKIQFAPSLYDQDFAGLFVPHLNSISLFEEFFKNLTDADEQKRSEEATKLLFHEIGHSLGHAHPTEPLSPMYFEDLGQDLDDESLSLLTEVTAYLFKTPVGSRSRCDIQSLDTSNSFPDQDITFKYFQRIGDPPVPAGPTCMHPGLYRVEVWVERKKKDGGTRLVLSSWQTVSFDSECKPVIHVSNTD